MFFSIPAPMKSASETGAKVTFAEIPADGQNKENDQPPVVVDNAAENIEEKPVASQPQQVCKDENVDDNETKIIPWRAQLRKTNSTLNLLE